MSIYTRDAAARSEHTQTGWPHSPPQSESGRCAQQCAQGQSGHVVTSRRCRRGDAAAEVSRQCELHHRYQRHATHVRKARSMILADRLIVLGTHSRRSGACHHVASTIQQNLPRVLWSCSAISEFGICRAELHIYSTPGLKVRWLAAIPSPTAQLALFVTGMTREHTSSLLLCH